MPDVHVTTPHSHGEAAWPRGYRAAQECLVARSTGVTSRQVDGAGRGGLVLHRSFAHSLTTLSTWRLRRRGDIRVACPLRPCSEPGF